MHLCCSISTQKACTLPVSREYVMLSMHVATPTGFAASQSLMNVRSPHSANHRERVEALLVEHQCDMSAVGVLTMLVRLRGSAMHANPRSPRWQMNPLRPHEMLTPAYLAMTIATLSATREVAARASHPIGNRRPNGV